VNRQAEVRDSKYVVIFDPLQPDQVTQRMCNVLYDRLHRENAEVRAWAHTPPIENHIPLNVTDDTT